MVCSVILFITHQQSIIFTHLTPTFTRLSFPHPSWKYLLITTFQRWLNRCPASEKVDASSSAIRKRVNFPIFYCCACTCASGCTFESCAPISAWFFHCLPPSLMYLVSSILARYSWTKCGQLLHLPKAYSSDLFPTISAKGQSLNNVFFTFWTNFRPYTSLERKSVKLDSFSNRLNIAKEGVRSAEKVIHHDTQTPHIHFVVIG